MKYRVTLLLYLLIGFALETWAQNVTPRSKDFFDFDEMQVNGTTGTPLGGFGAGGIKFNANDGTFAAMTVPPADAYDFQKLAGARIEMTVNGKTVKALKAAQCTDLQESLCLTAAYRRAWHEGILAIEG